MDGRVYELIRAQNVARCLCVFAEHPWYQRCFCHRRWVVLSYAACAYSVLFMPPGVACVAGSDTTC